VRAGASNDLQTVSKACCAPPPQSFGNPTSILGKTEALLPAATSTLLDKIVVQKSWRNRLRRVEKLPLPEFCRLGVTRTASLTQRSNNFFDRKPAYFREISSVWVEKLPAPKICFEQMEHTEYLLCVGD
jgi:hypothetical protein